MTEKINKINTHYSMTTPASVFDEEALTALQLAGRLAKKLNEVIDIVNRYGEELQTNLDALPTIADNIIQASYEKGVFWDLMDQYFYKINNRLDALVISAGDGTIPSELALMRNSYRFETFDLAFHAINNAFKRLDENPLPDEMLYSLFNKTTNLFNPRNVTFNLSLDCAENVLSSKSPDHHTTDYIDLLPLPGTITENTALWFKQSTDGETVTNAQVRAVNFYDENYRHITVPEEKYAYVDYIPVNDFPEFARYIRVTFDQDYLSSLTNFGIGYDYNACLSKHYTPKIGVSGADKWKGKNILVVGDSQVSQNKWQPYVAAALGVNFYNYGLDGYPVTSPVGNNAGFSLGSITFYDEFNKWMYQHDIATRIISDGQAETVAGYGGTVGNIVIDAVLILAGTNDGSYSIEKGNYNDTTGATNFSYKYTVFVDKVMSNVQDAEIYCISPPFRNTTGNLEMGDINIAIRDVSNYRGYRYINGLSAFHYDQKSMFLEDGIHFNAAGAEKFAEIVIKGLCN